MIDPIELAETSTASNPGGLTLSETRLRAIEPGMFGIRKVMRRIAGMLLIVDVLDLIDRPLLTKHLACGDARTAVVVSTLPVLVAANSDDLDCVAILRFPAKFADRHDLSVGTQLVTVNNFSRSL